LRDFREIPEIPRHSLAESPNCPLHPQPAALAIRDPHLHPASQISRFASTRLSAEKE